MMYREVEWWRYNKSENMQSLSTRYNPDMPMIIEHLHSEKSIWKALNT